MPDWVVLVVFVLAVTRLTGVLVADEITRPAREALLRRLDEDRASHRALTYLTSCFWCASIYVGAILAPLFWLWGDRWPVAIPGLALAGSQCAGMLSDAGRGE